MHLVGFYYKNMSEECPSGIVIVTYFSGPGTLTVYNELCGAESLSQS